MSTSNLCETRKSFRKETLKKCKRHLKIFNIPFDIIFVGIANFDSILVTHPLSCFWISMEWHMSTINGNSWLMLAFLFKNIKKITKDLKICKRTLILLFHNNCISICFFALTLSNTSKAASLGDKAFGYTFCRDFNSLKN